MGILTKCIVCGKVATIFGVLKCGLEPYQFYVGFVPTCSIKCCERYIKEFMERRKIKFFDVKGKDMDEEWQRVMDELNTVKIGEQVLDRRNHDFRCRYDQAIRASQAMGN